MKLIFLGPPGAGKGTQAQCLEQTFGFKHLSTGDMLRASVKAKTDIGLKIKDIMDRGDLVPDAIVVAIILDRITQEDCINGFILDGFPRNLEQAQILDKVLEEKNIVLDAVLELRVDHSVLLDRIKARNVQAKNVGTLQREDDTEQILKNRLSVYEEHTLPVSRFYADKAMLYPIDGMQELNWVTEQIKKTISS